MLKGHACLHFPTFIFFTFSTLRLIASFCTQSYPSLSARHGTRVSLCPHGGPRPGEAAFTRSMGTNHSRFGETHLQFDAVPGILSKYCARVASLQYTPPRSNSYVRCKGSAILSIAREREQVVGGGSMSRCRDSASQRYSRWRPEWVSRLLRWRFWAVEKRRWFLQF